MLPQAAVIRVHVIVFFSSPEPFNSHLRSPCAHLSVSIFHIMKACPLCHPHPVICNAFSAQPKCGLSQLLYVSSLPPIGLGYERGGGCRVNKQQPQARACLPSQQLKMDNFAPPHLFCRTSNGHNLFICIIQLLTCYMWQQKEGGGARGAEKIEVTAQNEWDPHCQHESSTMCKTTQLGATLGLITECTMQMMLFFFNACFNVGCCWGIQIRNLALMKREWSGKEREKGEAVSMKQWCYMSL